MKQIKIIIIAAAAVFLSASVARAAVFTVAPAAATDTFTIFLNTEGETVNAVEAHFAFNPSAFSITHTNTGGSLIELWVAAPTVSSTAGTLDFTGIIPGGIETAHAPLLTFSVAPGSGQTDASLLLATGTVLLDDGKGTPARINGAARPFLLAPLLPVPASATATPAVNTSAPDPFTPEIGSDPSLFGGKYFVAFAATDRASNIDHYEVLEVPAGSAGSITAWHTATSPYLLSDQTLSSDIYVKAVNEAGNFRTVEVPATAARLEGGGAHGIQGQDQLFVIIIVVVLAGFFIIKWRIQRTRRKGSI